jgi:hypothetical protein
VKIDDRKAAIAAFKKRKTAAGVFAVRCAASGQTWVGQTLNLDTVQNRIWFSLRVGGNANPDLKSAWVAHGAGAFSSSRLKRWRMRNCPMSGTRC